MKTTRKPCDGPDLQAATIVLFGSVIRVHDTPAYWESYQRFKPITDELWLMSSSCLYDTGMIQIVNLRTGACNGLRRETLVEVIHERGELMKISNGPCVAPLMLRNISEGKTLRFTSPLSTKHLGGDIFLRTEVCSSYTPRSTSGVERYPGKIGVVNLRSGALGWAANDRRCHAVDAEVCVTE